MRTRLNPPILALLTIWAFAWFMAGKVLTMVVMG